MWLVLRDLGLSRIGILERGRIGESFFRWPAETRLITPSFFGTPFGLLDLNAINRETSPAVTLGVEHPTGAEYARYLNALAAHYRPQALNDCEVRALERDAGGVFRLETSQGEVRARNVVWAAGEFQFPDLAPFSGADLSRHYASVESFAALEGGEHLVIGGFEGGIDAAVHLVEAGRRVLVLADRATWEEGRETDPSIALTPFTRGRLGAALTTGRLALCGGARVVGVVLNPGGGYTVRAEDGRRWESRTTPILATGFRRGGGAAAVAPWFDWTAEGFPELTADDESTRTPGLFLAGPQVRQGKVIFCFIYKFRQRFAVVARALARRLRIDPAPLEEYRAHGMFLDDLSCCHAQCDC